MRPRHPLDFLAHISLGFWGQCMIQFYVVLFAAVTAAAAFATGLHPGAWFFTRMTGFFPPHYGYSAYIVTALLFVTPPRHWLRWAAGAVLLLSGNRAAWVGAIAGWGWSIGPKRYYGEIATALVIAVVLGLALKPAVVRARTDNVRVQIWTTALNVARAHPEGLGRGNFIRAIAGREVNKAHSDLLQLLVEGGVAFTAIAVLLIAWGLYRAPEGPWKDLVVCLTAQSVIDNRLHHPACAALYALAWLAALLEQREPEE